MPIIPTITSRILSLTRRGLKCGHRQIVPASQARKVVLCHRCGAEIPPRKR